MTGLSPVFIHRMVTEDHQRRIHQFAQHVGAVACRQ
jgi:hypothetical protein